MATPPAQLGLSEVIKLRPVRLLWLAQVVSIFGDFLAIFAVMSVVTYQLHGTPAQVTLISIAFMLPFALISPIAGVFVDRWNVKQTMIASDLIRAVLALCLVFAANLNQIYVILFILSAVSTFFVPAQSVTLRTVVPKEGLLAANALIQQAFQIMRIISPALAGAMVAWFGANSCYYVDSLSYIFSATMIALLLIQRLPSLSPAQNDGSKLRSVITDMASGAKFIFTHATMSFVILSMAAGMFALSCFGPLIAVYVRDELNAGSIAFGIINSMIGIGMILGSLIVNRFAQRVPKSHLVIWGLLTLAVFVVVMAAFKNMVMAGLGTFGIGVGIIFIIVAAQTLMQQQTPIELVGRVSSSFMSVLSIAQLFGLVFSGSLAQTLGTRNLFYASAGLLLLITALGYYRLPQTPSPEPGHHP
jgi:MFS family permease